MLCAARNIFLFAVLFCCFWTPQRTSAEEHGLCYEFRAIRNLIPGNELTDIIQKHSRNDAKFKRALKFLRSAKFAKVAQQIENSFEYQSILKQYKDACVDVKDISTLDSLFSCLLSSIPGSPDLSCDVSDVFNIDDEYDDDDDYFDVSHLKRFSKRARNSQDFVDEIFDAIPKDRLGNLLRHEIKWNENFARFYKIIRDSDFQSEVIRGLSSRRLAKAVRILRKNNIDLPKLLKMAFELFSVGP